MLGAEISAQAQFYNCSKCRFGRHCNESNPAPAPQWKADGLIDNPYICPLPIVQNWVFDLIRLRNHLKDGINPFAGGILDWPVVFMRAIDVLDVQFNKIQEEKNGSRK